MTTEIREAERMKVFRRRPRIRRSGAAEGRGVIGGNGGRWEKCG